MSEPTKDGVSARGDEIVRVDPEFNPDYVMGPGDDVPRLATPDERATMNESSSAITTEQEMDRFVSRRDSRKGARAMRSRSGSFTYDNARKTAPEWATEHWYHIGDRVRWFGMLLRCGVDHYVGGQSQHPWDAGWGWGDGAALIWTVLTPDGMTAEAVAARATAESLREPMPV